MTSVAEAIAQGMWGMIVAGGVAYLVLLLSALGDAVERAIEA